MRPIFSSLLALFLPLLTSCGRPETPAKEDTRPAAVAKDPAKPIVPATVKITQLPFCCDNCVEALKAEFAKVKGLSDVEIDLTDRSVTMKLADEDDRNAVAEAVDRAGMHGFFEINGKKISETPPALDAKPATASNEIVLKKVHACCPGCKKAMQACARDAKVTLEGKGFLKTVRITGENLDRNAIILALWNAGYRIVDVETP